MTAQEARGLCIVLVFVLANALLIAAIILKKR